MSIYSTCKRISQKLLRNVCKFLDLIYQDNPHGIVHKVINANSEELVLQGPEGLADRRVVNSYPSKVSVRKKKRVDACKIDLATKIGGGAPSFPRSRRWTRKKKGRDNLYWYYEEPPYSTASLGAARGTYPSKGVYPVVSTLKSDRPSMPAIADMSDLSLSSCDPGSSK